MKITIQSLHFTATKELTALVTEKVNNLSQYYKKIESAQVTLKLDNSANTASRICEIRLAVPGNDLFTEHQCETFEEAVAKAADTLQQQLIKMKGKFEHH